MLSQYRSNLIWCLFLPVILWLTGCRGSQEDPDISMDRKVAVAIHIAPVNSRVNDNNNYFDSEKIKSLRIILVGTDTETSKDTVEFNRYIPVQNGSIPASDFQYDYVWRTKPGSKKFFIIANEESVKNIQLVDSNDSSTGNSADATPSSLTDILNKYETGEPSGDLSQVMNSIYFTPSYEAEEGAIFLPYASIYDNITIEEMDVQNVTMYLVPVATKFIFNFTNKREHSVNVYDLSLSFTNTQNYLFGHVGNSDMTKDLEGESMYWVDWLAKISEDSHNNTGYYPNLNFNEKYGWISNYEIPSGNGGIISEFVALRDNLQIESSQNFGTDEAIPGYLSAGPFYVPESRNFINPNNDNSTPPPAQQTQGYYFSMTLQDTADEQVPVEITNVAIDNLKALFRNTYCIIHIVLTQGEVEVYAEIADWNRRSIQGWVTEGQSTPGLIP